jgi:sterol desaturase/sphingolipid hydroxylase (fatty acid hydroxylase superfamily)
LVRLEAAHRLHHAERVMNFGVSTLWWDRLLGSYVRPSPGGQARSLAPTLTKPVAEPR